MSSVWVHLLSSLTGGADHGTAATFISELESESGAEISDKAMLYLPEATRLVPNLKVSEFMLDTDMLSPSLS